MNESEAMTIPYVIFAVLALIVAGFWILFPVIIYSQLKMLNQTATAAHKLLQQVSALLTPPPFQSPAPLPSPERTARCEFCASTLTYALEKSGTIERCPNCGNDTNLP